MKKTGNHAFVNQLLIYTLVMIGFSGSVGMGAVWLRHQISVTANRTKQIEGAHRRGGASFSRDGSGHRNPAGSGSAETAQTPSGGWASCRRKIRQIVRENGSPEELLAAKRNKACSPTASGWSASSREAWPCDEPGIRVELPRRAAGLAGRRELRRPGCALVQLHVIDRERLLGYVVKARREIIVEQARRGDILDDRGNILATSKSQIVLGVDPQALRETTSRNGRSWPR